MAQVTIRSLGRSSAYGAIAQIWHIGSRFVLTPLIIAKLGLEGYGVWTLLFTLCAYVSVINTSFGISYSKFTAEYDAKRDYRSLAQILGSGMMLIGSIAVVALTVLWLCRLPILRTLRVPHDMLPQAGDALLVVSVCVLVRMSVGCVFQVLAGLQRLDLQYKMQILASGIEFVVSIVLLYRGWHLLALALGHLCGQLGGTGVAWALCRRLCPAIRISPLKATVWGVRRVVSLGGRFQILALLNLFFQQGIRLLLSGFLGVSMLAVFEIAYKLLALGAAFGGAVIAPLMPAFSNLHASGSHGRFLSLYDRGSKVVSLVCMPCFAFLAVFADQLIVLWTANEYPLAAWTVRWMAVAMFVNMLTGVGTASLRGRGTVGMEVSYSVINVAICFVLFAPCCLLWGYRGSVGAIVTGLIVGSVWFLVSFARRESYGLARYFREILLRPALAFGPVIALAAALAPVLQVHMAFASRRVGALVDVLLCGILFTAAIVVCGWFAVLSGADRAEVARLLTGRKGFTLRGLPDDAGEEHPTHGGVSQPATGDQLG
ncbi:MAG: oligosaccharide flippase family protein [Phycisphaerales bacterium]|nr:MAG: oligosaccharide flippase family protein [Phycisphaerales bacterium]